MPGRRLRTGLVLLAVGALGACASVSTEPPPLGAGPSAAMETDGLFRVACVATLVFAEPSDRAPLLATLSPGALIGAQDVGSVWALVRQDGAQGFVDWRCLLPPEEFDPDNLVEIAAAEPEPAIRFETPEPSLRTSDARRSLTSPSGSSIVFDVPRGLPAPARRPEIARVDQGVIASTADRRRDVALAEPVFPPPPAPSTTRPQIAAAGGSPTTPVFDAPAASTRTDPGLSRPPDDWRPGATEWGPPEWRQPDRATNRPSVAALPPAQPGPTAGRPLTQFGPPPRYSAILSDTRRGAPPIVARAPPRMPAAGRFAVQIGSFRVPANAARAVAQAQALGFAPEIVRSGALHRIRLTGFGDFAAAEAERRRYLAAGGRDAYVVRM